MTSHVTRDKNRFSVPIAFIAIAALASSPPAHAEHEFTVKGSFTCTSQGVTLPVEGAIVAVMRDKRWAADPIETEVQTGPDGSFSAQWHSKDVDTYYAKLFLNDKQGVYLHDWWTLDVREFNSATRGTSDNAVIDLGVTDISRDNGDGTPRCAIWQGGRHAWQEFMQATGQRPLIGENGNYQIVMENTDSGIVWTSRDTTHWEMGYPTSEFSNGVRPIANPLSLTYANIFDMYGTNIHEFGHALRHTADGSDNHFYYDATRFLYAHSHGLCQSYPAGYSWNDGYGFNEGWADFWQGSDLGSLNDCLTRISPTDFRQESAVARDLEAIQAMVDSCEGVPAGSSGDDLIRRRRAIMFNVLSGAGNEKIHSDADFRAAFKNRFPSCSIPVEGIFPKPVSPAAIAGQRLEGVHKVHPVEVATTLTKKISSYSAQISAAQASATHIEPTTSAAERAQILVMPAYLRGQRASLTLLKARVQKEIQRPSTPKVLMTAAGQKARAAQVSAFDRQIRAIAIKALTEQRSALQAANATANADDISLLTKEIADIQEGRLHPATTMLSDAYDDGEQVKASTRQKP